MPLRPACLDILLSALGRGPFGRNRLSLARSCSSALLYWVGARTMLASMICRSACHETLLLELALYFIEDQVLDLRLDQALAKHPQRVAVRYTASVP